MREEEHILRWWEESPTRRRVISVNAIEKEIEAPRNAVQYFLSRKRGIAAHHLKSLVSVLALFGYAPLTNEHRFL
jgi:hypothetical protein